MSKLLQEYTEFAYDRELVKESLEKKQPIIMKTILQRADAKNQNRKNLSKESLGKRNEQLSAFNR